MREMKRRLDSDPSLALPQTEAEWWEPRLAECAIERAMLNASPKQLTLQRAFFDRLDEKGNPCDIFVSLGGNRSGKSFGAGWLCFALYLRDHARNGDWFWCVGQNLDRSVGGQQQELWKALPRWMFGDQTWDEKNGFGQSRTVVLPTPDNGKCVVEFRSADQAPHTFEQAKLTGVWIDERVSETIYGRLLPRIVDRAGWILYSDIPEQFWQLQRLMEAPPEAGVYFQHYTMYDNAHNLPVGAIDKTSARMTQDERDQKIAGKFLVMEGLIYREYMDHVHAIDPFPIPEDWPKWRSIDYGGSAPTACMWYAVRDNESIVAYREHYETGPSIKMHAKRILEASEGEEYQKTLIDPAAFAQQPGDSETIAQQYEKALGCKVEGWPRVNEMGEHAMVQKVKYRLENRTYKVFKPCVNHRREFRSWMYKLDKEGKPMASDAFDDTGPCHSLDTAKGFIATNPTYRQPKIRVY